MLGERGLGNGNGLGGVKGLVNWGVFDCEVEIYIIGGYDRLINKLRAKFVNMVSDEKVYKRFVGKDRVFILTVYVIHSDIYKIESLGIDGKFINSKGVNGIIREIEGCVRGMDRD